MKAQAAAHEPVGAAHLNAGSSSRSKKILMTNPVYPAELIERLDRLRGLVEHSDWHSDDPYQQTLRLHRWVEQLPAGLPDPLLAFPELLAALVAEPGRHTTQELLAFSALLHDLGKAETYTRQPDGSTRCQGHEAASARLAEEILALTDFSPPERSFILELVRNHGEPYALYRQSSGLATAEQHTLQAAFSARQAAILPALLLLAYGDLVTSHLAEINPEKYAGVEGLYRAWLVNIFKEG